MPFDKTVFIPVDTDTAFALITQPERLRRWQTVAARVDLRVGGEYRWTMTPGHSAYGNIHRDRARQACFLHVVLGGPNRIGAFDSVHNFDTERGRNSRATRA